jgi:AmiR/NasT family two-component response regulator
MRDALVDELRFALAEADARLDEAWATGTGLAEALERTRRLSEQLGRSPLIEDAKIVLARRCGCTPNEAYQRLVDISQRSNRKLREAARDLVAAANGVDPSRLSR